MSAIDKHNLALASDENVLRLAHWLGLKHLKKSNGSDFIRLEVLARLRFLKPFEGARMY